MIADQIHSATLNGAPVDTSGYTTEDGLVIPDLAGPDATNTLVIDADLLYTNTGEGLHRFVDPVDGEVYLYSQFETADAKRVFACFDQPDLKATFTFHITVPEPLAGRLERGRDRHRRPDRRQDHALRHHRRA